MLRLISFVAVALILAAPDASGAGRRTVTRHHKTTYTMQTPLGPITKSQERTTTRGPVSAAVDALAEVNAQRAARGLPPFAHDAGLTAAAQAAATFRASRLMFGHVPGSPGDFGFLPPGVKAAAAGCAAYPESYGFMACATYEPYRFAGAAVAYGADGLRYCHLFVR